MCSEGNTTKVGNYVRDTLWVQYAYHVDLLVTDYSRGVGKALNGKGVIGAYSLLYLCERLDRNWPKRIVAILLHDWGSTPTPFSLSSVSTNPLLPLLLVPCDIPLGTWTKTDSTHCRMAFWMV